MAQNNSINRPYATTPIATTIASWDANSNLSANSFLSGYTTTATAAGTTTLTVGSTWQQFFTGSTTQTVTLPVTSTLVLGQSFYIVNNSTGVVTVQSSGGNTVKAMAAGTVLLVTCILTSGTSAASWNFWYATGSGSYLPLSGGTLTGNIVFNPTTAGITGTTTNDDASSGTVGEFQSSNITSGSAVSLSSGVTANITNISLTAGDWDVEAVGYTTIGAGTTTQSFNLGTSSTSATLQQSPTAGGLAAFNNMPSNANQAWGWSSGRTRLSLSSTTTVYMVANSAFSVSTLKVYGWILARRIR